MKLHKILHDRRPRLWLEGASRSLLLEPEISLSLILAQADPISFLESLPGMDFKFSKEKILPPVDDQEVWACGVTYFSSRRARMTESGVNANVYDHVYAAPRPQVFPKARGRDVLGPDQELRLRDDSKWMVPEPELVLVLNSAGRIVGAAAGNDFSCRDIEGLSPLYQPQAKIWAGSCAIGPCIEFTNDAKSLLKREIAMQIVRAGAVAFSGTAQTSAIVRPLELLTETLFNHRRFPDGAYLFTGTGIIPPDEFALQKGDSTRISIEGIGELVNGAGV